MENNRFAIYLNDHLAAMTAENELAKRVASENHGTELAKFLDGYCSAVGEQREALKSILHEIGGSESLLKESVGWLAEKAGRFKLNDSLIAYSPLSRLLETEALIAAARMRLLLWQSLEMLPQIPPEVTVPSLSVTSSHLETLHRFHIEAVEDAFA